MVQSVERVSDSDEARLRSSRACRRPVHADCSKAKGRVCVCVCSYSRKRRSRRSDSRAAAPVVFAHVHVLTREVKVKSAFLIARYCANRYLQRSFIIDSSNSVSAAPSSLNASNTSRRQICNSKHFDTAIADSARTTTNTWAKTEPSTQRRLAVLILPKIRKKSACMHKKDWR